MNIKNIKKVLKENNIEIEDIKSHIFFDGIFRRVIDGSKKYYILSNKNNKIEEIYISCVSDNSNAIYCNNDNHDTGDYIKKQKNIEEKYLELIKLQVERKHEYIDRYAIDITDDKYIRLDSVGRLYIPFTQNGVLVGLKTINKEGDTRIEKDSIINNAILEYNNDIDSEEPLYVTHDWMVGKAIALCNKHVVVTASTTISKSIKTLYNKNKNIVLLLTGDDTIDTQLINEVRGIECNVLLPDGDLLRLHKNGNLDNELSTYINISEYLGSDNVPENFILDHVGVWYRSATPVLISSPIKVTAQTHDLSGGAWGRVIEVLDNNGTWRKVEISMQDLIVKENQVLGFLAGCGARINPNSTNKQKIVEYIQNSIPEKIIKISEKTGWVPKTNTFIAHDGVYGQDASDYIYRGYSSGKNKGIEKSGSIDEWNDNIVSHCLGSSRLLFALGLSFTAPILSKLDKQGFNVHIYGISSTGKSTLGEVACSVYRHGKRGMESWKTTANALESIAVAHNDLLLVLDEISQANEATVMDVIYMLANGNGKARGTKDGGIRDINTWTTIGISNGEMSIADVASRTRHSDGSVAGGIDVRMIELSADAGTGLGIFEKCNDSKGTIDTLKHNVTEYYGVAGLMWIEYIAQNNARVISDYNEFVGGGGFDLLPHNTKEKNEQYKEKLTQQAWRVYKNYEIVAFAGIQAIKQGILKMDETIYKNAITRCFVEWWSSRGGGEAREKSDLIDRVVGLLISKRYDCFINNESNNYPRDYWGTITYLDDNNKITFEPKGEFSKNMNKEVYFLTTRAFDKHFRGTLKIKQALTWLDDEGILIQQNKDDDKLKKQGKWSWVTRLNKQPPMSYYALSIENMEENIWKEI